MPVIDDLIAYISPRDSGFASRIAGAAPDRVSHFESLVGSPLPPPYRDFLLRLGKDDGGLRIGDASTTRLEALIEYYEDIARDGDADTMIPQDCIVVAYIGVGTFELSLEMGATSQPVVIYSSGREKKGLCAEAFDKLLFRTAFWRHHLASLSSKVAYHPGVHPVTFATLSPAVVSLGFKLEWFSDQSCLCATRNDAALAADVSLGRPMSLHIASNSAQVVDQVARALQANFGLIRRA